MRQNAYANESHELEPVCTVTNIARTILDAKYEKVDLNQTINEHFQHLKVAKQEQLLILLTKCEFFSDGSLEALGIRTHWTSN